MHGPEDDFDAPPIIDFVSPGRFAVHNPLPPASEPPPAMPARHLQLMEQSLQLIALARYQLQLCLPEPNDWLLTRPEFLDALRPFLLGHHRVRLQLLLGSDEGLNERFQPLLVLQRRLTDRMDVRIAAQSAAPPAPCLLCDDHSRLDLPADGRSGGALWLHDRSRLRSAQENFLHAWQQSRRLKGQQEFLL